jgi:putative intracellular protease/amidase
MRSRKHLLVSALFVLLLPLVCTAQTPASPGKRGQPGGRGTAVPRRGGAPDSSRSQSPGQRRPARGVLQTIQLPVPSMSGSVTVEAALSKVQSLTPMISDQPLKLSEISQLGWAAQGRPVSATTPVMSDERALMKVYFAMPDGLYLYVPSSYSLQETRDGDLRALLSSGLLGQQNAPVGGCQIVIGGSSRDFVARYGSSKARNVMLLLAGQMVQSLQLEAVALNLTFVGINSVDVATARKICGLGRDVEPLYVLIVGYTGTAEAATPRASPAGSFKKALIITPQTGFQDEEFLEVRRGLELNSVQVLVASLRAGPIRGIAGTVAQADLSISEAHAADFGAIVLIGGPGTVALFNTRPLWDLIREAAAQRKIIAASGNAPAVLAAAGVIKGSRVTGSLDIQAMLVNAGATYTGRAVEKDGPLVTSMGPGLQATPLFVQGILDGLAGM